MLKKYLFLVCCLAWCSISLYAQQPSGDKPAETVKYSTGPSLTPAGNMDTDSVTVTIVLKHQQDKNLSEIRRVLEAQGFWEMFPPQDARVVSWNLAMGLGHIIVMKLPAGAVRRLNLALENGAWGAFDTDVYLTYDYKPIWEDYLEKREEAKDDRN